MLDYQPEIRSDLSVFHRVDDVEEIGSARYYELAELLPLYEGALRARLVAEVQANNPSGIPTATTAAPGGGEEVRHIDDPHELEAISNQAGMLGFEYVGG